MSILSRVVPDFWPLYDLYMQTRYEAIDWSKISHKLPDADIAAEQAEKEALVGSFDALVVVHTVRRHHASRTFFLITPIHILCMLTAEEG